MMLTYNPKDFDVFIGIDVSKLTFSFTTMDHHDLKRSKTIPSNPENLIQYIKNQFKGKKIICAYEAGPTGFGLYDALVAQDIPCLVVAPTTLSRKPNQKIKNDKMDSKKLAKDLRAGELSSIHVPQAHWRQLRHLYKSYQHYVNIRMGIKRRIKSLFLFTGLPLPPDSIKENWTKPHMEYIKNLDCQDPILRQKLDMLLEDHQLARQRCLLTLKQIHTFTQNYPDIQKNIQLVRSIDGIGLITAITLLAKIGNPALLNNQRQLASFIGIIPSEHSSGLTNRRGSITHMGDGYLRSMLIESSWKAIKHNATLQKFFDRIKNRHHQSFGKQKAIVAVARKLTLFIYAVLKRQSPFMAH